MAAKATEATAIEHKATLNPMTALSWQGGDLTVVGVGKSRRDVVADVLAAVRDDTRLSP